MDGGRLQVGTGRVAGLALAAMAVALGTATFASATESGVPSGLQPGDDGASQQEKLWIPGEVVVRFEPGVTSGDRAAAADSVNAESLTALSISRARLVELGDGVSVSEAVTELAADPSVDFAEPNYTYQQQSVPNDPFFGQLWGLNNTGQTVSVPGVLTPTNTAGTVDADIDAPAGWDVAPVEGGDASDVVVAIVDSGIDYEHPDLAPNMWHNPGEIPGNSLDDDANGFVDDEFGYDFKNTFSRLGPNPCTDAVPPACADSDPIDDSQVNHGTHVAGTVGARGNDNYGVTGVAQRVQLMSVKVFDQLDVSSNVAVGNAFDYAGDNGAQVVNASLGGSCPSDLLAAAIESHPDVLFVVSAGNGGADGLGDNNDVVDDLAEDRSPDTCNDPDDPANANRHPGAYPCNFNAGPEAADYPLDYDFPNVMCVAASKSDDTRAGFSNHGPTSVQIAAPGFDTLSTQPKYAPKLGENAENPGFDNRLVSLSGTPITSATSTGWRRVAGVKGSFSMSESAFPGTNYSGADNGLGFRPASTVNLTGEVGCHIEWTYEVGITDLQDFVALRPIDAGTSIPIAQGWRGTSTFRRTPAVPELNGKTQANWQISFTADGDGDVGEGSRVDDVTLMCLGGSYAPAAIGMPLQGTHKFLNGTSMATPHVAGAAALILSKAPDLDPLSVIAILMSTGDANAAFANPGATPVESGKRLNLASALTFGSPPVPDTPQITGPTGPIADTRPDFTFTNTFAGSRFQCGMDSEAFGDCTTANGFSPASPLSQGAHIFKVRAIGGLGGVSTTATRAFTVDTLDPIVNITKSPPAKTRRRKAKFIFSVSEAAAVTCKLDSGAAAPCTSPHRIKVRKGNHTLTITATDTVGNTGDASKSWKVKKR